MWSSNTGTRVVSNTQIHDPIEGKSGSARIRKILQPIVVLYMLFEGFILL